VRRAVVNTRRARKWPLNVNGYKRGAKPGAFIIRGDFRPNCRNPLDIQFRKRDMRPNAMNTAKGKIMQKTGQFIDTIPLQFLVVMSIFLGLAPYLPFMTEPPHLYSKLVMLVNGGLIKPIDIFDLLLHGTPVLLLVFRLVRKFGLKTDA